MTVQERGSLISGIIWQLMLSASSDGRHFSDGETFFKLAFKDDKELLKIAKLCGVTS